MRTCVLVLLASLSAACTAYTPPPPSPDTGLRNATFAEIPSLKREAMAGSQRAAMRLAGYYTKHPSGDDTRARWSLIAAENGSATGQWNYAFEIHEASKADPLVLDRRVFWLRRAAAQGHRMAIDELKSMKVDMPHWQPMP